MEKKRSVFGRLAALALAAVLLCSLVLSGCGSQPTGDETQTSDQLQQTAEGVNVNYGLSNPWDSLMPYYSVKIATPYNFFDQIRRTYEHFDVSETAVEYGADVTITAAMPKEKFEGFSKQLTELTSAAVSPEILEETLLPQKIS